MNRPIVIVGAPSNIGIKPYDSGEPRGLNQAPSVLRQLGLADRVGAEDTGDVTPPAYWEFVRMPGRARHESDVVSYSRALADRVAVAASGEGFVLLLGGDCSVVLGGLLGVRRPGRAGVGLAYVDGHADFATPAESLTGSVASMCLGLAVGRGDTPLARLAGDAPLVRADDVALVGRRDAAEPWYGHEALHASTVLDVPDDVLRDTGYGETAEAVLARVGRPELSGFWIHVDADVIDPAVMPAVDSPEPGGPGLEELAELLRPLVRHPKALGMELTIYDPNLDSDQACGKRLVSLLETVLVG